MLNGAEKLAVCAPPHSMAVSNKGQLLKGCAWASLGAMDRMHNRA